MFEAWVSALIGLSGSIVFLWLRWPAWVGWPLSILLLRFGIDAGIAPLVRYYFGFSQLEVTDATIIIPASMHEIPSAIGILALGYGSIAVGMILIRVFFNAPVLRNQNFFLEVNYHRAYRGSYLLFLFGVFLWLFSMQHAARGLSLGEIASTRAVFTNEAAYGNALFNYAWLLRDSMQVGALGMLVSSYRLKRWIAIAWAANVFSIAILPVFGGRTAVIVSGLVLALVFHYGVRKLKLISLVYIVGIVLAGLVYIAVVRHGISSPTQAFAVSIMQVSSSRAIEEVAFAVRNFPEHVEYFQGETFKAGLGHFLPGLKVGENLWRQLEDSFLGKYYIVKGIGGQTISSTAESYMNFGISGVVIVGLIAGIFFGSLYDLQRRNPGNLFALLLAALTTTVFIVAIYKKLPIRISDIGIQVLIPIGFLATWVSGRREMWKFSFAVIVIVLGLLLFKITAFHYFKYLSFAGILFLYFFSIKNIVKFNQNKQPSCDQRGI